MKPIYRRWWFWPLVIIAAVIIVAVQSSTRTRTTAPEPVTYVTVTATPTVRTVATPTPVSQPTADFVSITQMENWYDANVGMCSSWISPEDIGVSMPSTVTAVACSNDGTMLVVLNGFTGQESAFWKSMSSSHTASGAYWTHGKRWMVESTDLNPVRKFANYAGTDVANW